MTPNHTIFARFVGPVILCASLLLIEFLLWALSFPSWRQSGALRGQPVFHTPDSTLGWVNKPGHFELSDGTRSITMNFNVDSSRRSSNTAASDQPTTLLLGDSFMQGYGLSDEATLGWLIQEKRFNDHIINLGTGGYGTYQSYLTLKNFLARKDRPKPEQAIYLFNDFHNERNVGAPSWQILIDRPPQGVDFFFPYGELSQHAPDQIREIRSNGLYPWTISFYSRSAALVHSLYWQVEAMHRLAKKRAVPNLVLKLMAEEASTYKVPLRVVFFRFEDEEAKSYIESLRGSSINWIDCALPEQHEKEYRLPDGHPNEAMNRLLATCILAKFPIR